MKMPKISVYSVAGEMSPQVYQVEARETWMILYQRYLACEVLMLEPTEARKIKKNLNKYTLIDGKLFRHGFTHPILVCVSGEQCTRIMAELHEGICGSHIGGRSFSLKVIRARYYWPTMRDDCTRYAQRCKQCQLHADWHKAPLEELRSIYSPWPFHTLGIDILGPFPLAVRQMKYLVLATVCRFGIPKRLVYDNGTQFASQQLGKLCTKLGVKQVFASVEHPQTNGQVESANRVLLRGLKRRLDKAKRTWAEEVPRIVWAYHTTLQSTTKETPLAWCTIWTQ